MAEPKFHKQENSTESLANSAINARRIEVRSSAFIFRFVEALDLQTNGIVRATPKHHDCSSSRFGQFCG